MVPAHALATHVGSIDWLEKRRDLGEDCCAVVLRDVKSLRGDCSEQLFVMFLSEKP